MSFLRRASLKASLPLLSLLLVSACSSRSGDAASRGGDAHLGKASAAIQGGTVATNQSFAVALLGRGMCSGTLIAPNLVLTARHCVEVEPSSSESGCEDGVLLSPSEMRVTTAPQFTEKGPWRSVVKILPGPKQDGCDPDIALVVLDKNIAESEAKPVAPAVDAAYLARPNFSEVVTAIGYGLDDQGNAGQRRIRENIDVLCAPGDKKLACPPELDGYVQKFEFIASEGACQGDSGGGIYDQKSIDADKPIVVGTVSRGPVDEQGICGPGAYVRVDKFSQFIVSAAQAAAKDGGYPVPEWAGGTTPATQEPPKAEPGPEEQTPAAPPVTPATTTTTKTTTSGCSASTTRAAQSSFLSNPSGMVIAVVLGLAAFGRRKRRR